MELRNNVFLVSRVYNVLALEEPDFDSEEENAATDGILWRSRRIENQRNQPLNKN